MGDDELDLNDLARFTKQSSRLLLEEYSHCEVPAGCGGVVLRWVDPQSQGVTVRIWLYTAAETAAVAIDAAPVQSTRLTLPVGRHVMSLALEGVAGDAGCVLFVASNRGEVLTGVRRAGRAVPEVDVRSGQDGAWRYTLEVPGEDWQAVGYDDRAWHPMVAAEVPEPGDQERGAWAYRSLQRFGASGLGLGRAAERVWIRCTFDIAAAPIQRDGGA